MATTDLKLEKPGSLPKPGPVGRMLRLGLAASCLTLLWDLVTVSGFLDATQHIRGVLWNAMVFALFLISYVINIGFSRDWKRWPTFVAAAILLGVAGAGYLSDGNPETSLLATMIWVLDMYVFSHLGLAFVLAALLGTPGCEMRAFHDLYSKITGVQTSEHYCPVGPLNPVDQWEARQSWMR